MLDLGLILLVLGILKKYEVMRRELPVKTLYFLDICILGFVYGLGTILGETMVLLGVSEVKNPLASTVAIMFNIWFFILIIAFYMAQKYNKILTFTLKGGFKLKSWNNITESADIEFIKKVKNWLIVLLWGLGLVLNLPLGVVAVLTAIYGLWGNKIIAWVKSRLSRLS